MRRSIRVVAAAGAVWAMACGVAKSQEPVKPFGVLRDEQTSIVYTTDTGEIAFDVAVDSLFRFFNVGSAAGIFTGNPLPFADWGKDGDSQLWGDLTGEAATWGDGDWDGAPGGYAGDPPPGDGVFDLKDIAAALQTGAYRSAPRLQPGDADMDLDQLDFVQVLQAGKYLTGEPATWGEGD